MTPRERTLALIVGAIVVLMGVWYAGSGAYSAFAARDGQIDTLRKQIDDTDFHMKRGVRVAEKLAALEQQALPKEPELARSIYKNWLVKTVTNLSMQNISVDAGAVRTNGEIYDAHSFTLAGMGDLDQVTKLLYEIQYAPILHRIQQLTLKPIKDRKELDVSLSLDVLSMRASPVRQDLPASGVNLSAPPLAGYEKAILDRNLFAPENRAPNLRVNPSFTAYRGQMLEFVVNAEDPDKLDTVRYEADVSQLPGAQFSAGSGKLQWTPSENGDYAMKVMARDNGFPNREMEKSVTITVEDPPPPPPRVEGPAPVAPPTFNLAKLAFVTAITEIGGEPQVWVTLRNEGRTLKLRIGEKFRVGDIEGHIAAIDGQRVIIAANDKEITAKLGESLAQ